MKLYVGNLPWSIDDKALKELFTSYGDIEEAALLFELVGVFPWVGALEWEDLLLEAGDHHDWEF